MKTHHLFLTGATGALGQALVTQLLLEPSVERIYVLLRRKPTQALPDRVTSVFGDIRNSCALGLSVSHQLLLQKNVTSILHSAADTRFDAPYAEAHATNVTGTENVLRFASGCPRIDRFMHLSTLCAAGKRTGRPPGAHPWFRQ